MSHYKKRHKRKSRNRCTLAPKQSTEAIIQAGNKQIQAQSGLSLVGITKGIIVTCLFMTYPLLVYIGIQQQMAWVAPVLFSAIYLLQAVKVRRVKAKLYKASIAVALLFGAFYVQTLTAKAMPVLIQLMLMFVFGRTLLKNHGPSFIERFVRLEFPQFPPGVSDYLARLTLIWTVFFAFNAVFCSVLALWASDQWWALYNGLIIYLLIGLLMIGEYIYRHVRFPELSIPNPAASLRSMIVNGRKVWMDLEKQ